MSESLSPAQRRAGLQLAEQGQLCWEGGSDLAASGMGPKDLISDNLMLPRFSEFSIVRVWTLQAPQLLIPMPPCSGEATKAGLLCQKTWETNEGQPVQIAALATHVIGQP